MNIQTLNKEQKEKLLEMCREFFPEYSDVETQMVNDDGKIIKAQTQIMIDNFIDFPYVEQADMTAYINYERAHWYQFCLTILPERIWSRVIDYPKAYYNIHWKNDLLTHLFLQSTFNGKHPVDFLYDFIKECEEKSYFKL